MVNFSWLSFRAKAAQGSDETLVEAARKGDRDAFDRLVSSFDSELRRFLRRKVAQEEVEDLVQETWVSAWGSLSWYNGRSKFRTWLYGIAIFKVKDHYRKKGRGFAEIPHDRLESESRQELQFSNTELQESIRGLLNNLSPAQKEVLELYYYAELTLAEIAQVLDRNLSTVKYQFYKAHAHVLEHAGELEDWRLYETSHMEARS